MALRESAAAGRRALAAAATASVPNVSCSGTASGAAPDVSSGTRSSSGTVAAGFRPTLVAAASRHDVNCSPGSSGSRRHRYCMAPNSSSAFCGSGGSSWFDDAGRPRRWSSPGSQGRPARWASRCRAFRRHAGQPLRRRGARLLEGGRRRSSCPPHRLFTNVHKCRRGMTQLHRQSFGRFADGQQVRLLCFVDSHQFHQLVSRSGRAARCVQHAGTGSCRRRSSRAADVFESRPAPARARRRSSPSR